MSQEDNHSLILDLPGEHKASFFAVYDGHGSARVSKHASEGLWRHLTENESYKNGNFKEALEGAFLTFDHEVNDSYNAQLAGTTAICVLIVDNIIYCANIGDSRAVASVNCECIPLSHDHKPENPLELKRILAAGGYVLGNRVNGNLALSRAFGDFHYKGNEQLPPEQQIVSPCPDIKRIELNDDVDFIVLACDGIWDVLTSEEVVKFVISSLEQNIEAGLICEQLTTRCIATDYELVIGCDNMTVLLVCYTRGRSWSDYCTDVFNKNSLRLGVTRTRTLEDPDRLGGLESEARRLHESHLNIINSPTTTTTISEEDNLLDRSDTNQDRADEFLRNTTTTTTSTLDDLPQPPTQTPEVPVEQVDSIPDQEVSSPTADNGEHNEEVGESSSSNITEIQLSSPDEDDETNQGGGEPQQEEEKDDSTDIVKEQPNDNEESNTIEIELSSPDEEETDSKEGEDQQAEEEKEEATGQDNPEEAQPTEAAPDDQQGEPSGDGDGEGGGGGNEEDGD